MGIRRTIYGPTDGDPIYTCDECGHKYYGIYDVKIANKYKFYLCRKCAIEFAEEVIDFARYLKPRCAIEPREGGTK